jgi:hypothetical protein
MAGYAIVWSRELRPLRLWLLLRMIVRVQTGSYCLPFNFISSAFASPVFQYGVVPWGMPSAFLVAKLAELE